MSNVPAQTQKQKFLVVVEDGKREATYKGILADSLATAMDSAIKGHMGVYRDVELNDIEATAVKMAG